MDEKLSEVSEVYLFFQDKVKVVKSYYVYSGLSLVAEIGGYIGLFLGVSINQITILASYLKEYLKKHYFDWKREKLKVVIEGWGEANIFHVERNVSKKIFVETKVKKRKKVKKWLLSLIRDQHQMQSILSGSIRKKEKEIPKWINDH